MIKSKTLLMIALAGMLLGCENMSSGQKGAEVNSRWTLAAEFRRNSSRRFCRKTRDQGSGAMSRRRSLAGGSVSASSRVPESSRIALF